MSYKKGHPKMGGRIKGTPNKLTTDMKVNLFTWTSDNYGKFCKESAKLEGMDFCKVFIQVNEFIVAKPQRITIKNDPEDGPKEITFKFLDPIDVTDEVSTFSELSPEKQKALLKKAKIKVNPRKSKYDTQQTTHERQREPYKPEPTREPPSQPTYTPPPPTPPPKKHEQMETIHVSRFNNNDFILR